MTSLLRMLGMAATKALHGPVAETVLTARRARIGGCRPEMMRHGRVTALRDTVKRNPHEKGWKWPNLMGFRARTDRGDDGQTRKSDSPVAGKGLISEIFF